MESPYAASQERLQLLVSVRKGERFRHAFMTLMGREHWIDVTFNPGENIRLAKLLQPDDELVPELTLDGPLRVENEPLYGEASPNRFRQWLGSIARGRHEDVRADSWPPATHGRDYEPFAG